MRRGTLLGIFAGGLAAAACGDRPDAYDTPVGAVLGFGLEQGVALVDVSASRTTVLTPHAGQTLDRAHVAIGKGAVQAAVSPDRKRLFVLSAGDVPRRRTANEAPSLTVIEGTSPRRFELAAPHSGIAIDPRGRYVALFAAPPAPPTGTGTGTGGLATRTEFVENPNEIVIVDLDAPDADAVTPRTLRSFGGKPQRVTFTDPLGLPGGPRRLLVVETDQDVHLLDLDNVRATPRRPEITVRLTSGVTAGALSPAGVVVDDGEPDRDDDARIGIRVGNGSSVFNLTLVPSTNTQSDEPGTVPNDFRPEVSLTDVDGVPGDIVFVRTDAGLRLAAVVPSTRKAVLVDPTTNVKNEVPLPEAYSRIALITNIVGGEEGADTALLYGGGSSPTTGVAFLSLGRAIGQSYRTAEVVSLASPISTVHDVPPPRPELKVLEGSSAFFVLNLASRTASPLTTVGAAQLHVSSDGQRVWAYRGEQLAQVRLDDLHPVPLPLDREISSVFDVATPEGGRALVALTARGAWGATVLDALAPDTTRSRSYYGLLLEGL